MIKEMVSKTISEINEITHDLCGWTIKKMVSETVSQVNEVTHPLCGA